MIIIDITNPLTLVLLVAATVLIIFLAKEVKRSYIVAIPLFIYLIFLITHVVQLVTITAEYASKRSTLTWCIILDFVFVFITFFSYLWVDDIETKKMNKKSISKSLDWFWKEV